MNRTQGRNVAMKKILKLTLIVFGGLILLFASVEALSVENSLGKSAQPTTQALPSSTPLSLEDADDNDDLALQDNPAVYKDDDPDSVVTMYLTVRIGNASDNSDHTWEEVNKFTKWIYSTKGKEIVVVGKAEAIVQFGDETGPLSGELGYNAVLPNATIQIRGASSSLMPQKSWMLFTGSR